MFDNVVNLAQKLIQFKTISGNYEEIVQCISFLDSYAKKNNLFIQVFDNQNKPVVILSNEKTRFFDVMSLGHIDVVPGDDALFTPIIDGDNLKGRGAFDMKTGVAVGLELLSMTKRKNLPIKMGVVLTSDEEVLFSKTMQYVGELGVGAKIILDTDGLTGLSNIVEKTKNAVFARLVSKGEKVSSRQPWKGVSAIDSLLASLQNIRKLFPYCDKNNIPDVEKYNDDYWFNHLTIGKIEGGSSIYRVSAEASADLDFRVVNGIDSKKIAEIIKSHLVNDTVYETIYELGYVNEDRNNPVLKMYQQLVEAEINAKVNYIRDGRASNASMLPNKENSVVIMHSYSGGGYHAADEFVLLPTVKKLCTIQRKFIEKISRQRS